MQFITQFFVDIHSTYHSLTVLDQALSLLQRQTSVESLLQATIIDSSDDTLSPSRLEKCLLKHWSTKRLFWLRLTSIIFPQLLEAIRILFEDSNGIMYEISSCKTWTGVISVEGVKALPFEVPITKRPTRKKNVNNNQDFIEVISKAYMIHQFDLKIVELFSIYQTFGKFSWITPIINVDLGVGLRKIKQSLKTSRRQLCQFLLV